MFACFRDWEILMSEFDPRSRGLSHTDSVSLHELRLELNGGSSGENWNEVGPPSDILNANTHN